MPQKTKLNLRKGLTQFVAAGLGLGYAVGLAMPPALRLPEPMEPVRVVFKSQQEPPRPAPPAEETSTPVAPRAQAVTELPLIETPLLAVSRKEGADAAETVTAAALEEVATGPAPPSPPNIYAPPTEQFYAEKPGGPVLVLALLVDTHGNVYNAKIVVPSHNPLADLTYLLSAPGLKMGKLHPAFPEGEQRWIEIRVRFTPPGEHLLP